MATPARPPPSPAILLVYPATLLLGSLFSAISPTARSSRSQSTSPASPLAPSLAANLHISESPVNYFARKNNIFNLYFVKIGWLWTTVAFASLLLAQPAYRFYSSLSPHNNKREFDGSSRPFYDMSSQRLSGKASPYLSPPSKLESLLSATTCKAAGGAWRGGHDISGHVFMLVLTTAMLAFEAIGVGAFSFGSRVEGDCARERKASDPNHDAVRSIDQDEGSGLAVTWSLRLVWGVVGLGWWMLFMTAIWFHTWLEKWSGLFVAMSTIYAIYILPRKLPAWRDIVGIPGA
ncbi:uncharacterized protein N7483_010891 [Penicillium malachiteum]|uniref:uncharacterized protein n=1 Tax=Penicillium malachiteum TaxID=1324776 RepID=UPI002546BFA4|nr:uncharacterized protein N7483_010891 [Penicillium malachiteum]KAJ5713710.1 hypothetical protein N7483_010891 [Penicillium malachiteum]